MKWFNLNKKKPKGDVLWSKLIFNRQYWFPNHSFKETGGVHTQDSLQEIALRPKAENGFKLTQ